MAIGLSPGIQSWRVAPSTQRRSSLCAGAFALTLMAGACLAQGGSNGSDIQPGYHPEKDTAVTAVNQRPDPNRLMEMRKTRVQTQRFAAANAERKRQMSADSARLLQLAAALNLELEKTVETDLSLAVKAEMIEKLARTVKEKMKLTMAAP